MVATVNCQLSTVNYSPATDVYWQRCLRRVGSDSRGLPLWSRRSLSLRAAPRPIEKCSRRKAPSRRHGRWAPVNYARDEFAAAQDLLKRAGEAVAQRDYRLALNYALDSREQAQNAARLAADGKASARVEADRAHIRLSWPHSPPSSPG